MPFEMDESIPVRWNRQQWLCVFSSHSPTIRKVTEYLGLGLSASSSNTNRGIPKFDAPEFRKLSSEVQRLSKDLPKDRDALLDVATDGQSLETDLDELLETLGPAIWGRDADRSRLLRADPLSRTYPKDLYYDDAEDREIIKTHVHRWIVIKACYYIRNQKLKRYSAPGESESITDFDQAESPTKQQLLVKPPLSPSRLPVLTSHPQSPNQTPQSGTPVPETTTPLTEPVNDLKRKSDAFLDGSDGDVKSEAPAAKRPYSSATLPNLRKSPRKSLSSAGIDLGISPEKIPPTPVIGTQRHVSTGSVPPEASRPMLSPLSSNALNEGARPSPPAATAVPAAVPAAVAAGFTPVNAPKRVNSPLSNGYTSPYGVAGPQLSSSHAPAPAPAPAPVNVLSNGASAHNSPIVQSTPHPHMANIAPKPQAQQQAQPHSQPQPPSHHPSPVQQHQQPPLNRHPQPIQPIQQSQQRPNTPHAQPAHHMQPIQPHPPNQAHQYHQPPQHQTHPQHPHQYQHPQQGPPAHAQQPQHAPPPAFLPSNAPHGYHPHSVPNGPTAHVQQPQIYNSPNFSPRPANSEHLQAKVPSPQPQHQSQPPPPQGQSQPPDMKLQQYELFGILINFLHHKGTPRPDEDTLFQKLEFLWSHNAPNFRRQMGPLYEAHSTILNAWIEERRKISQLQRTLDGRPGVPPMELIDRLLAMNDLRVMRLKWKAMKIHDGERGITPEELLCRTFSMMTQTEGTEQLIQQGLEKLNESNLDFLKSDDMKITVLDRSMGG